MVWKRVFGRIALSWTRGWVVGLIMCAWVFLLAVQASGATFFQDGKGYWWDFREDGAVLDGSGASQPADTVDAFDGAMRLEIEGVAFPNAAQATVMSGRMLVTGPAVLSGLNVTRRAYVPSDPAEGWACFLEYLENPTDATISVRVRVVGNLGSDAATTITGSSSGDTTFSTADRWVTSNDDGDHHDPNLSFNYWGLGAALMPDEVLLPASQADYYVRFSGVAVPAHATVVLMHFCSQNADATSAIDTAMRLDGLPAAALTALKAFYAPVINWNVTDALNVSPSDVVTASGPQGGPFVPASYSYTLTNTGAAPLNWTATGPAWLTLNPASGTGLAAGGHVTLGVAINAQANTLAPGDHTEAITISNTSSGVQSIRNVRLSVVEHLGIQPSSGFAMEGFQGGPFTPSQSVYQLTNSGTATLLWSITHRTWVDVEPGGGSLDGGQSTSFTLTPNANALILAPGQYSGDMLIVNQTFGTTQTRPLSITVNERLDATPTIPFVSRGLRGGPFTPSYMDYTLRNLSPDQSVTWSIPAASNPSWLTFSPASGTLAASASVTIRASIASSANTLAAGDFSGAITIHNDTYNSQITRNALLRIKDVVRVDKNAPGPAHEGTTWATAFTTIKAGISAAASAASWVWVADGVYPENLTMASGVEVYGGFHGNPGGETLLSQRDPAANVCVLNGSGAGAVVVFGNIASAGLDGFTVTGGNATGAYPLNSGGGIRCDAADNSNFIQGCAIQNNAAADRGAGICCLDGAAPSIAKCLIAGNDTDTDFGGGLACINSAPLVTYSVICGNHGRYGGGVGCIQCSPTLINCVISGNRASSAGGGAGGGGVFAHDHSSPVLVNCVISGNVAKDWGGGALFCQDGSSPVLTNCTVGSNTSNSDGSGIQAIAGSASNPGSMPVLTNCIFDGMPQYAFWCDAASKPAISHCLFHHNGGADYFTDQGAKYTGGDVIDANVAGAHDNVAGDPDPRFQSGLTGVWTQVVYNLSTNTTLLTASASTFTAGALVGALINADISQTRQALVLANTDHTVTVPGDITEASGPMGYVKVGDAFQVVDYETMPDSPCLNTGDNAAPNLYATDILGQNRIVEGKVDLGAYENPHSGPVTVLDIAPHGGPAGNLSLVCFDVTFSRAVANVTPADFVVDGLGPQAAATIDSVTGHDYRWEVCVRSAAGNGALTVDLVDADHSITDSLGYALPQGYNSDPNSGGYYVDHLAISTQPQGCLRRKGDVQLFQVRAGNGMGELHYIWMRNGSPATGAPDEPDFIIAHLDFTDEGTYTCEVSDDYTAVTSEPAALVMRQGVPVASLFGIAMSMAAIGLVAVRKMKKP